ncbi:MAG: hypothetical protein IJD40_08955 [Lachnospiraceae bacterium]|nr:hypothetical protein [Lachnospiraceae bacterium]
MFILAIIIGCFIGFGLACMWVGTSVAKSNDHGDSKGNLLDFTEGSWQLLERKDNIRKPRF